jgi:hypothetical protein
MNYCHDHYEMYPVWLCPHKTVKTEPEGMLIPQDKTVKEWEMYVDIGLYGPVGLARRGKK